MVKLSIRIFGYALCVRLYTYSKWYIYITSRTVHTYILHNAHRIQILVPNAKYPYMHASTVYMLTHTTEEILFE